MDAVCPFCGVPHFYFPLVKMEECKNVRENNEQCEGEETVGS